MNLNQIFKHTRDKLEKGKVSLAKRETSLIFRYILNINKEEFFLNPNRMLNNFEVGKLNKVVKKRLIGYPLQYIIGKWEFYGLEFYVGEDVLIPRKDTEILVEKAILKSQEFENPNILDLCSGSGCIGIALSKMIKGSKTTMIELSEKAFKYLEKNIEYNDVKNTNAILGDILSPKILYSLTNEKFDIIVSNPPYIPTKDLDNLQKEVKKEPKLALDGKEDGLYFYKWITKLYKKYLSDNGYLLYEIGINQENDVVNILKNEGFNNIEMHNDLSNIPRVLIASK